MSRELLSGMQLGLSLGVHHRYAGMSFDEAIRRVADVAVDHPQAVYDLLSKWIARRKMERPDRAEREKKALGRQAIRAMSDEELADRIAMGTGRMDRNVVHPDSR